MDLPGQKTHGTCLRLQVLRCCFPFTASLSALGFVSIFFYHETNTGRLSVGCHLTMESITSLNEKSFALNT